MPSSSVAAQLCDGSTSGDLSALRRCHQPENKASNLPYLAAELNWQFSVLRMALLIKTIKIYAQAILGLFLQSDKKLIVQSFTHQSI